MKRWQHSIAGIFSILFMLWWWFSYLDGVRPDDSDVLEAERLAEEVEAEAASVAIPPAPPRPPETYKNISYNYSAEVQSIPPLLIDWPDNQIRNILNENKRKSLAFSNWVGDLSFEEDCETIGDKKFGEWIETWESQLTANANQEPVLGTTELRFKPASSEILNQILDCVMMQKWIDVQAWDVQYADEVSGTEEEEEGTIGEDGEIISGATVGDVDAISEDNASLIEMSGSDASVDIDEAATDIEGLGLDTLEDEEGTVGVSEDGPQRDWTGCGFGSGEEGELVIPEATDFPSEEETGGCGSLSMSIRYRHHYVDEWVTWPIDPTVAEQLVRQPCELVDYLAELREEGNSKLADIYEAAISPLLGEEDAVKTWVPCDDRIDDTDSTDTNDETVTDTEDNSLALVNSIPAADSIAGGFIETIELEFESDIVSNEDNVIEVTDPNGDVIETRLEIDNNRVTITPDSVISITGTHTVSWELLGENNDTHSTGSISFDYDFTSEPLINLNDENES